MKRKQSDAEFIEKVRNELDRSVADLDAGVAVRLRRARRLALAKGRQFRTVRRKPKRWLPAAAFAAAAFLLAVVFVFREPPASHPTTGIEDVEILASTENPDFFRELDFFFWLAEEMDRPG